MHEKKQAVVVIHGMGQQKPMGTLRSFVEAVWETDSSLTGKDKNEWWIKPDKRAGLQELRRITTGKIDAPGERAHGKRLDFYEFYWADIMQGTTWQHLTSWVRGLLFRLPANVPWNVMQIWLLLWALLLAIALYFLLRSGNVFIETGLFCGDRQTHFGCRVIAGALAWQPWLAKWVLQPLGVACAVGIGLWLVWQFFISWQRSIGRTLIALVLLLLVGVSLHPFVVGALKATGFIALAMPLLVLGIHSFLVSYFGDVARYVMATPDNVAKRKQVRDRGLELLRGLHESGEYDRIVVVSHSLGTIIAYDLLNSLWAEIGPQPSTGLDQPARDLMQGMSDDLAQAHANKSALPENEFRDAQRAISLALAKPSPKLKLPQNNHRSGWLITDFVTLGSPLTHAEFLLATTEAGLDKLIDERILSLCPPALEPKPARDEKPERPPSFMYHGTHAHSYPHHAACFCAVRWTNIYDSSPFFLTGDVISGRVSDHFGVLRLTNSEVETPVAGGVIRENLVKIKRNKIPLIGRIFTHTQYWTSSSGKRPHSPDSHIQILRRAINILDRPENQVWGSGTSQDSRASNP